MRRFFCVCMTVWLSVFLYPVRAENAEEPVVCLQLSENEGTDHAESGQFAVDVTAVCMVPFRVTADECLFAVMLSLTLPDGWFVSDVQGREDTIACTPDPDGSLRILWDGAWPPDPFSLLISVPTGADREGEITLSGCESFPSFYMYEKNTDLMSVFPVKAVRMTVSPSYESESGGQLSAQSDDETARGTEKEKSAPQEPPASAFLGWQAAWNEDGTGAVRFLFAAGAGQGSVLPIGGGSLHVTVAGTVTISVFDGRTLRSAAFSDPDGRLIPLTVITVSGLREGKAVFLVDTGNGRVRIDCRRGLSHLRDPAPQIRLGG